MMLSRMLAAIFGAFVLMVAGCGDDDIANVGGTDTSRPTIVVTTTILGDVVQNVAGSEFDVVAIMPFGADPHDFQASAQQVAEIGRAEVLIFNGAGFEEGLLDVIDGANTDGVMVFEAMSAVQALEFGDSEHSHVDDDHDGDEHDDDHDGDEHDDDHDGDEHDEDHPHAGVDPHFWTDPARMAIVADTIAEFLIANVGEVNAVDLRAAADEYVVELNALDHEIGALLADIDEDRRVLVTNHDAFGYFADRYDFDVVGTVIPSGSTADGTSAKQLAELGELIEHEGVSAIFTDSTVSDELAQTLADEVGDVAVVGLFTGSLGERGSGADSYIAMVRTNAERIVKALAG